MQSNNNIAKGKFYEEKALKYLISQKYKILYLNYKNKLGEIDIICELDDYIIFVEVKYRKTTKFGYPKEAVTKTKQNKIKKVSLIYISNNGITNKNFRYDVIEFLDDKIDHITNAFWF